MADAAIEPGNMACEHIAYSPERATEPLARARGQYLYALAGLSVLVGLLDRDLNLAAGVQAATREALLAGDAAFSEALALSLDTPGSA